MSIEDIMQKLQGAHYSIEGVRLWFDDDFVLPPELASYFTTGAACEATTTSQGLVKISPTAASEGSIHDFWRAIRTLIERAGGRPLQQSEEAFDVLDELPER